MAMLIQNPAKCEVRAVIRFLLMKGETAAEICQLVYVYGEDVMNRQNVAKWCREFEVEGCPLSLMKSSKILMKTFVLTDV
jgi:hypothetical protein